MVRKSNQERAGWAWEEGGDKEAKGKDVEGPCWGSPEPGPHRQVCLKAWEDQGGAEGSQSVKGEDARNRPGRIQNAR